MQTLRIKEVIRETMHFRRARQGPLVASGPLGGRTTALLAAAALALGLGVAQRLDANCLITADKPFCAGTTVTFSAAPDAGYIPIYYIWRFHAGAGDILLTEPHYDEGPALSSISITLGTPGPYAVGVEIYVTKDGLNYYPHCSLQFEVVPCERPQEFCTVTQGFWGSAAGASGKFNGKSGAEILPCLLGDGVTVGVPGDRSLTITDAACILSRLPGSGTPAALPDFAVDGGVPDRTIPDLVDPICNTENPAIPLNKNGRFKNTLLGQTITLALNLRMDGALGSYVLPPTITTVAALPGLDGVVGEPLGCMPAGADPNDDIADLGADCDAITWTIPSCLEGLTVNELLNEANRALAGLETDCSLSDINIAVSAVNEGFDKCRFLAPDGCPPPPTP